MSGKLKSRISINFSEAEYSAVKERSDNERMSISSYCRRKILGKKNSSDSRKENTEAANKAFMNDLKEALKTDQKGFVDIPKIKEFKAKYKL